MSTTQQHEGTKRPPLYGMTDEEINGSGESNYYNGHPHGQTGKATEKSQPDYQAIGEKIRIRPEEDIPAPPICLSIQQEGQISTFGTLGNFSVLIGKAKSRKTSIVSVFVAAAVMQFVVMNRIGGSFHEDKRTVLVFDTEQSRFHVLKVVKRICRLANQPAPTNLLVYPLRALPTQERLGFIQWHIYNTPNVGLVVIDGIRDLVHDINDNSEATERAGDLLRWTEERNIHILTVIHVNKGNDQIRGSIGTELQNKAETVVSISIDPNDKNISIVKPEYCRDREFDAFAFSINEQGLPCLVEDWSVYDRPARGRNAKEDQPAKAPRTITPGQLPRDTHESILRRAFTNLEPGKYAVTCFRVKDAAGYFGHAFGDNRAKEFVAYYLDAKLLHKDGAIYTLNLAPPEEQVTNPEESSLV